LPLSVTQMGDRTPLVLMDSRNSGVMSRSWRALNPLAMRSIGPSSRRDAGRDR
jgi:hypothetical protein